MNDVARLAGVSQSTVSRVLSDTPTPFPVTDETRQRIREAVETLGYQPNMIGDISNAFYHPIVRAVQDVAAHVHNYDVLISNGDHLYENEIRFLQTLLRRPVDGVIIAPHRLTMDDLDNFIRRSHIPVVAVGAQVEHPLVDVVGGTSQPATYEAISWMIKQKGHRRIGFMGIAEDMVPGPARFRGYQRAMTEAGLEIEPGFVQKTEFTVEGGAKAMRAYIEQGNPPTALFASNSLMAIGAILTAKAAGLRVPQDIGVMGFDDIPEAVIVDPPLTLIARDLPAIGKQVADMLFERISGDVTGPGRFVQSPWKLIERDSV
jgi:DNA-binding LacI/PurR family transcriptional regulator